VTPAVAQPVAGAAPLEAEARALFAREVAVATGAVVAYVDDLTPAEAARIARARPKRRHEYATGRRLARRLLAGFGRPGFSLVADDARAPVWPEGLVGSISHSAGMCVVAVARRGELASLGVDLEQAAAVRPELWPQILDAGEAAWLRGGAVSDPLSLAAVFFAAKEAVYKAQFPITRARLGFHDVHVELEVGARRFHASVPGFARALAGRFALAEPFVLAGIALGATEVPS
jgi:4'-phosphopantetheinyl transferase EntD